jgi:hypothetical protein
MLTSCSTAFSLKYWSLVCIVVLRIPAIGSFVVAAKQRYRHRDEAIREQLGREPVAFCASLPLRQSRLAHKRSALAICYESQGRATTTNFIWEPKSDKPRAETWGLNVRSIYSQFLCSDTIFPKFNIQTYLKAKPTCLILQPPVYLHDCQKQLCRPSDWNAVQSRETNLKVCAILGHEKITSPAFPSDLG